MEHEQIIYGQIDDFVGGIFTGDVTNFTKGVYFLHDLLHEKTVHPETKAYVRTQLNEKGGFKYINSFIEENSLAHLRGHSDDILIALNGEFLAGCDIVFGPVLSFATRFFTNILEG